MDWQLACRSNCYKAGCWPTGILRLFKLKPRHFAVALLTANPHPAVYFTARASHLVPYHLSSFAPKGLHYKNIWTQKPILVEEIPPSMIEANVQHLDMTLTSFRTVVRSRGPAPLTPPSSRLEAATSRLVTEEVESQSLDRSFKHQSNKAR